MATPSGVKMCPNCDPTHPVSFDDAIRRRGWNRLNWECPHCILVNDFPLVWVPELGRPVVANLAPDTPKERWERHQGSVLGYGLMNQNAESIGFSVAFGEGLDPDVEDSVLRYRRGGTVFTYPVQLKRVTRNDIDPHDELNERIADLARYQVDDLIVGISIEREFTLEWKRIVVPKMRIFELWLMRVATADGITWAMHGFEPCDPGEWKQLEFIYPSVLPGDPKILN